MSCEKFERLIALDAGGDLAPADAERVRSHIETCGQCRDLARAVRDSHASLGALSESDGLDEQALAAWRRGVLRRIENEPRRPRLSRRWAWAPVAALALVALVWHVRNVGQAVPPAQVKPPRVVVAQAPPPAKVGQAVPPANTRRHRHPTPAAAPAEPLLVKLETPDPNVVIYWIVDSKGD